MCYLILQEQARQIEKDIEEAVARKRKAGEEREDAQRRLHRLFGSPEDMLTAGNSWGMISGQHYGDNSGTPSSVAGAGAAGAAAGAAPPQPAQRRGERDRRLNDTDGSSADEEEEDDDV